ncbi:ribonuclease P protein component [Bacillus sp. HMF5848]|uniref:ribonuclease P protein component n=1 Tax=Bacillus sp. HMF5848 TaxID=2495421 RepID=UPI000F78E135|nr:ribonuclease P protein component [Bacillus sp. HMF5848]RSK29195.1 ribonuclease P protein component [Bacillus sp. HMF5848]
MKKALRLKKNEDFQVMFQKGRSMANRQFVLYYLKKDDEISFRVGLSVSKKLGNAVTRNRIKRMIRRFFQEHKDMLPTGYDYLVIARKPVADMNYSEAERSLGHVLYKADLTNKLL